MFAVNFHCRNMLWAMVAVVWLATFSDGKRRAENYRVQSKYINRQAEAQPFVQASLAAYEAQHGLGQGEAGKLLHGHEVVGLAAVEPVAQHHALLSLCEEERCQFNFWSMLGNENLEGKVFYFRVLRVDEARHKMPLSETRTGRQTCFFHLNPVWADRCFSTSVLGITKDQLNTWKNLCGNRIPTLTLRMPSAIAFLIYNRQWTRVAVPDSLTGISLAAGWASKHVLKDDRMCQSLQELRRGFACLPSHRPIQYVAQADLVPYNPATRVGKENLQKVLQEASEVLLQGTRLTEERREKLQIDLLSAAQGLQHDLFSENIFKQESLLASQARTYSALRLLNYFWVSGVLQSDKNLRSVLKLACTASLHENLAKEVVRFIDGDDHHCMRVPSTGTISRVRGRLDVAWMLLMREFLSSRMCLSGGAGLRLFMQTDATWQAKQEYQVTLFSFIDAADRLQLHKDTAG